jgi:hypothetical protein
VVEFDGDQPGGHSRLFNAWLVPQLIGFSPAARALSMQSL